jgi:hypothetical protein
VRSAYHGPATALNRPGTRTTAPELNGGEGASPSGRGAALGSSEALGPTHGERGGVRWLGTNSVVGTEVRRDGGSLPEADKRPRVRTTSNGVASSYRCVHRVRGTGRLGRGVQRTGVLGQCECAGIGTEHSEAAISRSWCGGDAEGIFVGTPVARR